MMLEFFRRPDFWAVFVPAIAAAASGGFYWGAGLRARRLATIPLLAAPALLVWIGYRYGAAASVVTIVTASVLAALARDLAADRTPYHAVVPDRAVESADTEAADYKLAS